MGWKLVSPVLYLAASVLAGVACVWTMVFVLSDFTWIPQAAFFAVPFLLVGAVLVPCGWGLLRLERSWKPTLPDHLRHCAFLYATLVILGGSWLKLFYDGGVALALVEFGVFFYTALAILINAFVLLYLRRRFDYITEATPERLEGWT